VGEPVIRKAVDLGMRLMGKQFVAARPIAEALDNARAFEAQGLPLLVRHAGRGGDDGRGRAALLRRLRARDPRHRPAAAGRGVHRRARASRSSSRRCTRAIRIAQRDAS
jgi:RHH-type proline utilization regulon transcriptional repressor/proline dehydrogenase/delta 1-pyrroline-5-carboxylate dehydrogenase